MQKNDRKSKCQRNRGERLMDYFFLIMIFCNLIVLISSQYSMLMLGKSDGNSILAVNFPTEYLKDLTLNLIAREYTLNCYKIFYPHLVTLLLFYFTKDYQMISINLTLIYCFSLSICYMLAFNKYRKKIIKVKREQGWYFDEKSIITVDTEVSRIKESFMLPRKWFIPPILLTVVTAIVLFSNPLNVAGSWNLSKAILALLFITYIISYEILMRMSSKVYSDDTEINIALNLSFKQEWSKAFIYCSYTNVILVPLLNMTNRFEDLNMYLFITCLILITLLPLAIIIWTCKKVKHERNKFILLQDSVTPKSKKKKGKPSTRTYFTDEDDHYILGGFYHNKSNPSTFVEKRVLGMGLTINLATKWGKIYMGATIILMLGLFLFTVSQIPLDFWHGATLTQDGDTITINAHSYTSELNINDINSVEMIDELPKLSKTNGTATNKVLLGSFSIQGYGKGELFINREVENYILIKLNNDEYIILNSINEETTLEYYENFQEYSKNT